MPCAQIFTLDCLKLCIDQSKLCILDYTVIVNDTMVCTEAPWLAILIILRHFQKADLQHHYISQVYWSSATGVWLRLISYDGHCLTLILFYVITKAWFTYKNICIFDYGITFNDAIQCSKVSSLDSSYIPTSWFPECLWSG